ncbi:MAG: GerAB/ArcD/ProY family transporter [Clostridiales bacterium]|nr:GerAB/ArcD/ProY family transporter [Clostridiales bacterium]
MYLNNERISTNQLKRLIVFNLLSISLLVIPSIAVSSAGREGLISILIALLFALIYSFYIGFVSKATSGNLIKYSKDKCGGFLTYIVGLFYILKYIACLILYVKLFARVIKETLLEDGNIRLIILMLILASAYLASKGLEVRARIAEILYLIILVPVALFLILGLKKLELGNILPIITGERKDIIYGAYRIFIIFTSLEFLIFKMDLIRVESKRNQDKKTRRLGYVSKPFINTKLAYILKALFVAGIINVLVYLVTVGTLGIKDTSNKLWSSIYMIQIIDLPGNFLQRHDALIISIWILSIFVVISGFFYYLLMISKEMYGFNHRNYMILPFIILVFFLSIIPIDIEDYYVIFERYMMGIGFLVSILVPLIVIIIGKIKSAGNKKIKLAFLIIATVILFSLTGCRDMTEIEDRDFIQAIGIDYIDGQISLSLASPDLAAYTDGGPSDEDAKEKLLKTLTGNDFYQLEEEYLNLANRRLDFSHLQVVILGRQVVDNKDLYYSFLTYIENKYEISRNTLVVMSDSMAQDIMVLNSKMDTGIGDYIYQLYRINVLNKGREEVKLQNLLLSRNEEGFVVKLPVLGVEEDNIEIAGAGFIREGRLVYETDKRESIYINLAKGYGNSSRIFIEDNNKISYVIKLNKVDQSIDIIQRDGKPFMILRIEGDGDLEKGLDNGKRLASLDNQKIKEINIECNKYLEEQISSLIENLSKKEKIDFLNASRLLYSDISLWKRYKGNVDKFLDDLDYHIEVNIGL